MINGKEFYTFYDDTGRINMCIQCDADSFAAIHSLNGAPLWLVGQSNPSNDYVRTHYGTQPVITPLQDNPTVQDGMTLKQVPKGTQIYIEDTVYQCDDGTAELSFAHPGTFVVRVTSWPFLPKEFTIENPA